MTIMRFVSGQQYAAIPGKLNKKRLVIGFGSSYE